MNKAFVRFVSAALLALGVSASAFALPMLQTDAALSFQDINAHGATLSANQSVAGSFNIVSPGGNSVTIQSGYANAGQTFTDIGGYVLNTPILSATAYFYIRNGNQGNDVVYVDLGGTVLSNGGLPTSVEILSGAASISLLQTNGTISYTVKENTSNGGASFIFDYAQLQVTIGSDPKPNGVPDGGATVAMLGAGLAAVGLVGRRMRARA